MFILYYNVCHVDESKRLNPLVSPCYVKVRESDMDEGRGEKNVVHIKKCRSV